MKFPVCGARPERLLPKIPPEYYHVLNSIIECSIDEAQSIYNKFRAIAPTGRLNLSNFQECLGLFGTLARLLGERMFRAFDLNNDDHLDFVEFASSLLIMSKGSEDKKLALSYRILHPNPKSLPSNLISSLDSEPKDPNSLRDSRLDSFKFNSSHQNSSFSFNFAEYQKKNKDKNKKTKEERKEDKENNPLLSGPNDGEQNSKSVSYKDKEKEKGKENNGKAKVRYMEPEKDSDKESERSKNKNKDKQNETEHSDSDQQQNKDHSVKKDYYETSDTSISLSFLRRTTETIINTTKLITSNLSELGYEKLTKHNVCFDEDSGIQFGEFVDVVNDIALTKALLVCRDPRYYTTEEIRKVFQKYASVSREGIQRLTQSDYVNAVCESSEFLELLGVSLSQYAMETVSSTYKGVNLFLKKINVTTRSYINRTNVRKKNVYKWINNSESKRGLSVHFGHESWNHVVNMMIGLSISARYVYSQVEHPLSEDDYNVKLCFNIVENSQGLNVTKYIANTGMSSSRFSDMKEYTTTINQNRDANKKTPDLNNKKSKEERKEDKEKQKTDKLKVNGNEKDKESEVRFKDGTVSGSEYDVTKLSREDVISSNSLNIISSISNSSLIGSDVDFRFSRFYKENLNMGNPFSYIIKSKMIFKEYAPMVFRQIRKISGLSEKEYIESVSPEQLVGSMVLGNLSTMSELMSEGKSGALFYYTINGRLIVKTITKRCAKFVKGWLYRYYEHLVKNPDSILTRFYGLFSMENVFQKTKVYFITMNNVFYSKVSIHRRFDLKGSWVGRRLDPVELKDPTVALKDQDFDKVGEVILLGDGMDEFLQVLKKDVMFLSGSNLLDYSLLLGVHYRDQSQDNVNWDDEQSQLRGDQHRKMANNKTRIYYMGIVDLLTPWNFTKKVEHLWRMIQTNDHQGVSCVNPNFYSSRFLQFIENHVK